MAIVEHLFELDDGLLDGRIRELEVHRRRTIAEQALAIAAAEARQLHVVDGHHSMNSYLRATLNCSTAEASQWRRLAKLIDTLPGAADALVDGRIGVAQAHELARVRSNPRCGNRLAEVGPLLLEQAETLEFDDFRTCVRRWEMLADEDGAHKDRDHSVESRNASAVPSGAGIDLHAAGGDAVTAAELIATFNAFIQAEFDRDQAVRLAEFGDDAAGQPFARTGAQRRFDALTEIFRRAANAPDASGARATSPSISSSTSARTPRPWSTTVWHRHPRSNRSAIQVPVTAAARPQPVRRCIPTTCSPRPFTATSAGSCSTVRASSPTWGAAVGCSPELLERRRSCRLDAAHGVGAPFRPSSATSTTSTNTPRAARPTRSTATPSAVATTARRTRDTAPSATPEPVGSSTTALMAPR